MIPESCCISDSPDELSTVVLSHQDKGTRKVENNTTIASLRRLLDDNIAPWENARDEDYIQRAAMEALGAVGFTYPDCKWTHRSETRRWGWVQNNV